MAKNTLQHKGYKGSIEWSEEDNCYYGSVLGVRDLVMYEGSTKEELEKDFKVSVDEWLEVRKELDAKKKRE